MEASTAATRVVVIGRQARSVGHDVRSRRGPGVAVAGFVGGNEHTARQMAEEMLGGVDEVVRLASEEGRPGGAKTPRRSPDA